MSDNDFYQIILLTSFEPCLYNFPCRISYTCKAAQCLLLVSTFPLVLDLLDFAILNERREQLCKSIWYVSNGLVTVRFYHNRMFAENVVRLQMTTKFFSNFTTVLILGGDL